MKKLIMAMLIAMSVMLASCVAYAQPVPVAPGASPQYGCFVVEDGWGEREVCNAYYYTTDVGPVYWDSFYSSWIGGGYYWFGNVWYRGYWPTYYGRYGSFYHYHGWYGSHGYRGYYGSHWSGGHYGGGYYGGYHGGGGWHGGGHGGGRR
jgi:hypothetical protein